MNKRTLVIGDIHGGLKALIQVLERANVTTDDTLIFLGDYVDGWSESPQVIRYLLELTEKQDCIFIKGNHDFWCEQYLKNGEVNRTWLFHGGALTFENYQLLNHDERQYHLNFFERMKLYYIDDSNRLFIHAGFTSMKGPEQEFHQSNYNWDRTLWEMALVMDKSVKKQSNLYPKRLKLYSEIYIGHTPTLNYNIEEPMQAINVWNIDTGVAFTGKLTILDIDTKEFWQSDPLPQLYPNEKGRN